MQTQDSLGDAASGPGSTLQPSASTAIPIAKHTPGPWVIGNQDPLCFGKQHGNGTEPIGFVYGPSFAERSELGRTALANARLIAAAPELLEALQMLLSYTLACEALLNAKPAGQIDIARSAISRATGTQA